MTPSILPQLLERLRELALVELDTLLARLPEDDVPPLLAAYVADLEDALAVARGAIRDLQKELGAGPDPLGLVDLGSGTRSRGGEAAMLEASAKLGQRAAVRRELARLEELMQGVLPRLLEADRRLVAIGPQR